MLREIFGDEPAGEAGRAVDDDVEIAGRHGKPSLYVNVKRKLAQAARLAKREASAAPEGAFLDDHRRPGRLRPAFGACGAQFGVGRVLLCPVRSEEHTSELQSLMRISYAVFCLKKKK